MNSSTLGNPDIMVAGTPPPPPPPPVSGHLPAMRINTAENAAVKRPQLISNDVYEPPAAIQNAMLTKDKKPFTYTPGMGGKLDLSQIRSPRMARRVAKNANDEGIEGPPKSAIESKPSPAVSPAANLLMPQVAVPVFPSNVPPQPHVNRMSQPSLVNRTSSNATDKQVEPARNIMKVDTKVVPITVTSSQSSNPESPSTPTQVTLLKAPTPWLQNKNKSQEELPEWAKRTNANKTAGNDSSENALSPVYVQVQESSPQCQQSKPQQLSQRCQEPQQQRQNSNPVTSQQTNSQSQQHERVIPIRIDDRPSVFDAKHESGHHQFKQCPTPHHQQRWGQAATQRTFENQAQKRHDQEQSQIHVTPRPEQPVGTYIIPLVVEGSDKRTMPPNTENNIKIGKVARVVQQRSPDFIQQQEAGPIQSRSFRVLQKITDTDESNNVGTEQIRKLELSEDEKLLMNKFKEQVDHETYLHQEKDPRYRGAAIPSRAFRFLQNMTDSNDASVTSAAPHNVQNVANKRQNRNSKSFEETQANLPPSEQQVQEPKKYTGSAIPSRSFRILQAMTASENTATQENHQADYTYRTENNLPGNQQDAFFPPRPISFWSHSEGWWSYYPEQCNGPSNKPANETDEHSFPYLRHPDESAYIGYESFYPVYGENFTNLARIKITDQESSSDQYGYVAIIHPQVNYNNVKQSNVDANSCNYIHNYYTAILPRNNRCFAQNGSANESRGTFFNEINHLDGAHDFRNVCDNCDSNKNCIITAMNIVDEEDDAPDSPNKTVISNNIKESEKTFGLHINVPNYVYIDTSDSSDSSDCSDSDDSSDSGDSISNNEHLPVPCQKYCNNTTSSNTLSNSDSDLCDDYSMDLNPCGKVEKNPRAISSGENWTDLPAYSECSITADNPCRYSPNGSGSNVHSEKMRSKKNHVDRSDDQNSCATLGQDFIYTATKTYDDEDYTDDENNLDSCPARTSSAGNHESNVEESPVIDGNVAHQLSVIYEDVERLSSESPLCGNKGMNDGRNDTPFEVTDSPFDNTEAATVSVSLPLKFRFSVSEDNEDIATVIVGNSKVKAEKSRGKYSTKNDKDNARVSFHGTKRPISDAMCATMSANKANIEIPVTKMRMDFAESVPKVADDRIVSESAMATRDISLDAANYVQAESTSNNCGHIDENGTTTESKLVMSERSWMRDNFGTLQVQAANANQATQKSCCIIVDNNDDRCVDPEFCHTKRLLSVQDSREDTDDEDSGVTSDISRIISEIDTDSECTISKSQKKYQRTQTHSRLFRLLNDDSTLSDCTGANPSSRKECPSLPFKMNAFNYDDNYCSNYSSGVTSPEYLPIHEQSRQKFHDAATDRNAASLLDMEPHHPANQPKEVPSKGDPYFLAWKNAELSGLHEHDVVPSPAFRILNNEMPFRSYKANVLCPRIKSTKNVPRALLADRQIGKN